MNLIRQTLILTKSELSDLLSRRRLMLGVLVYLGVSLLGFSLVARIQKRTAELLGDTQLEQKKAQIREMLISLNFGSTGEIVEGLSDVPMPLVVLQVVILSSLPMLVALMSSDMVTLDIYRGTLRYVLLRSTRTAYYLSKQIAHLIFHVALQALAIGGSLFVVMKVINNESLEGFFYPALIYFLMLFPALWCLLAVTQCISSWVRKPKTALLLTYGFYLVALVVAFKIPWASPFHIDFTLGLIFPFAGHQYDSVLGLGAWSLSFLMLGLFGFLRRDV